MSKAWYSAMMLGLVLGTMGAAGCALDAPSTDDGGDVEVSEEASALTASPEAGDQAASGEIGQGGATTQAIEIRNVTCNSGWPGTRGCSWKFSSPSAIVPGTITVQINGNNGELGHAATQVDSFHIDFTASVREGDAFNPGVNTTSYTVAWLRS